MKCDECHDLISFLGAESGGVDECSEAERRALDEHLAGCEACRLERDVLAAGAERLRGLEVHPLSASEVGSIVAAAMPLSATQLTRSPSPMAPSRWTRWASHAAAVLLGALLMSLGRVSCQASDLFGPSGDEEIAAVELVREVIVEVPVERIVEKPIDRIVEKIVVQRVEVPVEVAVEVPVKVPIRVLVKVPVRVPVAMRVEVPVETVVERIVYRDRPAAAPGSDPSSGQPMAAPLERRGGRIAQGERRSSPRRSESTNSHLEIRRENGAVTLVTRGSLSEIVPVLIDTLDARDELVVAAAFDRLLMIRSDFGAEAVPMQPRAARVSRVGGVRGLFSKAGFQATEDRDNAPRLDPALWRGWWSRQQVAGGIQIAATSI